jgi:hypothetical protein
MLAPSRERKSTLFPRGGMRQHRKNLHRNVPVMRALPNMKVSSGTVHALPADLRKAPVTSPKALAAWNDIKPLARNDRICWTISVKNPETRKDHVRRGCARSSSMECVGRVAG